jgi:CBS domain-containing protein/beta-phosphoglucomutase-like phosphatase (HAD superfamily)
MSQTLGRVGDFRAWEYDRNSEVSFTCAWRYMTLQAIIIRADGALAETEDVRREAFAQVFSEAGFDWSCDRQGFALTAKLGNTETRMAHYVRACLRGRPESEDLSHLIQAMHRGASKAFGEMIVSAAIGPRPGIRDLIVAARTEKLRLVLVALLESKDAENLVCSVLGSRCRGAFECIVARGEGGADAAERLYQDARAALDIDPQKCLVIEAGRAGAVAAKAQGFPVLVTRSAVCPENRGPGGGCIMVEDLPSLIPLRSGHHHDPLTPEDRADLLSALYRLHAGKCESLADLHWSDQMRVSDILKAKGSAVKTIEANATMRALAHSFRSEAIGAMLVLDSSGRLQGIISERDLVRGLDEFGADLPLMPVSHFMTRSVVTCAPEDSVAAVANVMTQRRIRHVPVAVKGAVVGLISIGDVLKHRLDEVQLEANVLRDVARYRS